MRLKIASRKSDLARIQAFEVGQRLKEAHPGIEVDFEFRESLGDKNLNDPLWKMPEKGVFTQDFYQDLIRGEADMVVHSWKDLPVEDRDNTEIYCSLPRADARDVLLFKKSAQTKVQASRAIKIFSSSPRREYNLTPFLKDHLPWQVNQVVFESVRGNVPTRVRKLLEADSVDALIVAKAALDRLLGATQNEFLEMQAGLRSALKSCLWMCLPLSANPTAAAQGALAIEVRKDRSDMKKLLDAVACCETFEVANQERKTLKAHGGGCHQKIGISILSRPYGRVTFLKGLTEAGTVLNEASLLSPTPPTRALQEQIWPSSTQETFFHRKEVVMSDEAKQKLKTHDLWVARAQALPESYVPNEQQLIWTAGLETWRKLAERNVWVNGSAEGLGEAEAPRVEQLSGQSPSWLKLSHDQSSSLVSPQRMPVLGTYKLVPNDKAPDLRGKKHFYWMSGSTFLHALKLNPEIQEGHHYCGPGNTFEIIKGALGTTQNLHVRLSYKAWLKEMEL